MASGSAGGDTTAKLENTDYTVGELFEGSVFHIPDYQRFYSWEQSEWSDLWQDLFNILDTDKGHYLGTIICRAEQRSVLTGDDTPNYRGYGIVDGQQRLTTLVLLVRAIGSVYADIDETELAAEAMELYDAIPAEEHRRRFVIDQRIKEVRSQNQFKLHLQDDDDEVFRSVLKEDIDETAVQTPSQRRLIEAYRYYRKTLKQRQTESSLEEFLHELSALLRTIQSLRLIVYTVDKSEEATLIFESVNDRGIGLSNLDKTKSFLMHSVYVADSSVDPLTFSIDTVQQRFGQIYRWMQDISETDRVADLSEDQVQRYHYISNIDRSLNASYLRSETTRRNKTLRSGAAVYLGAIKWHFTNLRTGKRPDLYEGYPRDCIEEIDEYTDSLTRYYSHMETIGSYGSSSDYDPALNWELQKIFALDRLGNFYPLLLTVWDEHVDGDLSRDSLHEIFQLIEVASFRIYTTVSRSDTGRGTFYTLANDIATDDRSADWIIGKLKQRIRSKQNDFEALLRNPNAYERIRYKDLRYLLFSYELYLRHRDGGGGETSIQKAAENAGNDYTLDHIWPQDTSKLHLSESDTEIHEEIKHSLGNLTLTTGPRNSSWKNRPYDEKKNRIDEGESGYLNSDFTMTRAIARKYDQWGQTQIEDRLDDIVGFAQKRWSLDADIRRPKADIRPSEVE